MNKIINPEKNEILTEMIKIKQEKDLRSETKTIMLRNTSKTKNTK